jgi:muconolactone delta-isomerase
MAMRLHPRSERQQVPLYKKLKDGSFSIYPNDPGPKFQLMTNPDEVPADLRERVLSDIRARAQAAQTTEERKQLEESLVWKGTVYEYHLVNIGAYDTEDRLRASLDSLGSSGWKLVHALDKSSNWLGGMEKVFLIFMREAAS